MDFKKLREERELLLKDVAELSGYGVSTISDFERTGEGSERLKEKLLHIYQLKDSKPSIMALREVAGRSEVDIWRDRAKAAEKELAEIKDALRAIVNSKATAARDKILSARAAEVRQEK